MGHRIAFYDDTPMEIVGVSGNVRHFSFERAPRPEVYVPYLLDPWPFLSLVVKTEGDPGALVEPGPEGGVGCGSGSTPLSVSPHDPGV